MKKWDIWSIWNGALISILGLLLIIFNKFFFQVLIVLLGVGAIAYGIYNLKITRAESDISYYNRTILIRGIVSIIIGVIAIFFPIVLGETVLKVIIWILAIYLIISSGLGFYAAALLKNTGVNRKKYIIENIGLLVLAVVLMLISPKSFGPAIVRIIGIVGLALGVIIIVVSIIANKKANSNIVEDAEVTDIRDDDLKQAEKADETIVAEPVKDDAAKEEKPKAAKAKPKAKKTTKKSAD